MEAASTRLAASTVCARTAPDTVIEPAEAGPDIRAAEAVIVSPASTVPEARTARPTTRSPVTARSPPAARSVSTSRLAASIVPAPSMALPAMSRSASIRLASANPGIATR